MFVYLVMYGPCGDEPFVEAVFGKEDEAVKFALALGDEAYVVGWEVR